MAIIKKPGKTKIWTSEVTCTGAGNPNPQTGKKDDGCGAILEISKADLFYTFSSAMGRYEQYFVTFACPCCGTHTDIQDTPYNGQETATLFSKSDWEKFRAVISNENKHQLIAEISKIQKEFLPDSGALKQQILSIHGELISRPAVSHDSAQLRLDDSFYLELVKVSDLFISEAQSMPENSQNQEQLLLGNYLTLALFHLCST